MMALPLAVAECVFRLPWMQRPTYLAAVNQHRPQADELGCGVVILEVRDGHQKWAHLVCPRCGDHIELPLAGRGKWAVRVDGLRRPTFTPSIWERASCRAHFFVRRGEIHWCA